MNSQVFQHIQWLVDSAYQIAGISQLSASSMKPAGIESGVALRTLLDVETQRFALLARDWEEFHLEVARKAVTVARRLYKGKGKKVKWGDRTVAQEIDWKEVSLDQDAYVMRIYPTNLLPSTPAGKLATIQEMMQMGGPQDPLLDAKAAKSLLDFPDLDRVQNLSNAAYEDMIKICDLMLYQAKYTPPQAEMDLELGIQMAQHHWCEGHMQDAPEENLDMLIGWMEAARQQLAASEPPPPPMPEGMPPGMGGEMGPEGLPPEMMGEMGPMPGGPISPDDLASPADDIAGLL